MTLNPLSTGDVHAALPQILARMQRQQIGFAKRRAADIGASNVTLAQGAPGSQVTGTVSFVVNSPDSFILVFGSFDLETTVAGTGALSGYVRLDGAAYGKEHHRDEGMPRFSGQVITVVDGLAAGAHTLALWAGKANAGGTAIARPPAQGGMTFLYGFLVDR